MKVNRLSQPGLSVTVMRVPVESGVVTQSAAAPAAKANRSRTNRMLLIRTSTGRHHSPISARNSSSVSTGTFSDCAFSSFDPAASPATRYEVFDDTDDDGF